MTGPGGQWGGQDNFGTPPLPLQPASQEEISGTPLWHLFNYDLTEQTFSLMRIEEQTYREVSFLDHRMDASKCPMVRYEMRHMGQMFPRLGASRGPMGYIFHIGHCGSTLLSRALSVTEHVLPIREPLSLRALSADHHELDTPMSFLTRQQWGDLLSTIVDSMSRRFRPGQMNVIKATSTSNDLIAPILQESGQPRALLLYLPLEGYLATMLGKPREASDLWGQARKRMRDWINIEGSQGFCLHELGEPQLATLSWLTSMNHMLAARDAFGERVMMLDFEDLIADPETTLTRVTSFFDISKQNDSIVEQFPGVSSGYSKRPDKHYTPETRNQILHLTRTEHADAIKTGVQWAQSRLTETPALTACENFIN
jgi:hypothetical protein